MGKSKKSKNKTKSDQPISASDRPKSSEKRAHDRQTPLHSYSSRPHQQHQQIPQSEFCDFSDRYPASSSTQSTRGVYVRPFLSSRGVAWGRGSSLRGQNTYHQNQFVGARGRAGFFTGGSRQWSASRFQAHRLRGYPFMNQRGGVVLPGLGASLGRQTATCGGLGGHRAIAAGAAHAQIQARADEVSAEAEQKQRAVNDKARLIKNLLNKAKQSGVSSAKSATVTVAPSISKAAPDSAETLLIGSHLPTAAIDGDSSVLIGSDLQFSSQDWRQIGSGGLEAAVNRLPPTGEADIEEVRVPTPPPCELIEVQDSSDSDVSDNGQSADDNVDNENIATNCDSTAPNIDSLSSHGLEHDIALSSSNAIEGCSSQSQSVNDAPLVISDSNSAINNSPVSHPDNVEISSSNSHSSVLNATDSLLSTSNDAVVQLSSSGNTQLPAPSGISSVCDSGGVSGFAVTSGEIISCVHSGASAAASAVSPRHLQTSPFSQSEMVNNLSSPVQCSVTDRSTDTSQSVWSGAKCPPFISRRLCAVTSSSTSSLSSSSTSPSLALSGCALTSHVDSAYCDLSRSSSLAGDEERPHLISAKSEAYALRDNTLPGSESTIIEGVCESSVIGDSVVSEPIGSTAHVMKIAVRPELAGFQRYVSGWDGEDSSAGTSGEGAAVCGSVKRPLPLSVPVRSTEKRRRSDDATTSGMCADISRNHKLVTSNVNAHHTRSITSAISEGNEHHTENMASSISEVNASEASSGKSIKSAMPITDTGGDDFPTPNARNMSSADFQSSIAHQCLPNSAQARSPLENSRDDDFIVRESGGEYHGQMAGLVDCVLSPTVSSTQLLRGSTTGSTTRVQSETSDGGVDGVSGVNSVCGVRRVDIVSGIGEDSARGVGGVSPVGVDSAGGGGVDSASGVDSVDGVGGVSPVGVDSVDGVGGVSPVGVDSVGGVGGVDSASGVDSVDGVGVDNVSRVYGVSGEALDSASGVVFGGTSAVGVNNVGVERVDSVGGVGSGRLTEWHQCGSLSDAVSVFRHQLNEIDTDVSSVKSRAASSTGWSEQLSLSRVECQLLDYHSMVEHCIDSLRSEANRLRSMASRLACQRVLSLHALAHDQNQSDRDQSRSSITAERSLADRLSNLVGNHPVGGAPVDSVSNPSQLYADTDTLSSINSPNKDQQRFDRRVNMNAAGETTITITSNNSDTTADSSLLTYTGDKFNTNGTISAHLGGAVKPERLRRHHNMAPIADSLCSQRLNEMTTTTSQIPIVHVLAKDQLSSLSGRLSYLGQLESVRGSLLLQCPSAASTLRAAAATAAAASEEVEAAGYDSAVSCTRAVPGDGISRGDTDHCDDIDGDTGLVVSRCVSLAESERGDSDSLLAMFPPRFPRSSAGSRAAPAAPPLPSTAITSTVSDVECGHIVLANLKEAVCSMSTSGNLLVVLTERLCLRMFLVEKDRKCRIAESFQVDLADTVNASYSSDQAPANFDTFSLTMTRFRQQVWAVVGLSGPLKPLGSAQGSGLGPGGVSRLVCANVTPFSSRSFAGERGRHFCVSLADLRVCGPVIAAAGQQLPQRSNTVSVESHQFLHSAMIRCVIYSQEVLYLAGANFLAAVPPVVLVNWLLASNSVATPPPWSVTSLSCYVSELSYSVNNLVALSSANGALLSLLSDTNVLHFCRPANGVELFRIPLYSQCQHLVPIANNTGVMAIDSLTENNNHLYLVTCQGDEYNLKQATVQSARFIAVCSSDQQQQQKQHQQQQHSTLSRLAYAVLSDDSVASVVTNDCINESVENCCNVTVSALACTGEVQGGTDREDNTRVLLQAWGKHLLIACRSGRIEIISITSRLPISAFCSGY